MDELKAKCNHIIGWHNDEYGGVNDFVLESEKQYEDWDINFNQFPYCPLCGMKLEVPNG
jgi:hypothetical protein